MAPMTRFMPRNTMVSVMENQKITPSETQITSIKHIKNQILLWRSSTPITFKAEAGYFVKKEELNQCHDFVLKQLTSDPAHSAEWEQLSAELDELRKQSVVANNAIAALRADSKKAFADLADAKQDAKEWEEIHDENVKNADQVHKSLIQQLELNKAEKIRIAGELEKAKYGVDLESLERLTKENKQLSESLQDLQNELQISNAAKAKTHLKKTEKSGEIKKLQTVVADLKAQLSSAETARLHAFDADSPVVHHPKLPTIATPLLSKLIGPKGIKWIHEAEKIARDDYKDRAMKLMLASKHSKDENTMNLGKLLEIVFQWLKRQSWAVRKKVSSWIDRVERDIRMASIKSITFYRDQLSILIREHRLSIENINEAKAVKAAIADNVEVDKIDLDEIKSRKLGFFENLGVWAQILSLRAKRAVGMNPKLYHGKESVQKHQPSSGFIARTWMGAKTLVNKFSRIFVRAKISSNKPIGPFVPVVMFDAEASS